MKNCELCSGGLARMHCESDQANLCWDCDLKVHGANFLVAKHTRTLLCHVCQNPTPWLASGDHITPAVSVCQSCTATTNNNNTGISPDPEESSEEEYEDEEQEEDEDYYIDDDDEQQEEEEAENQVVPWSGDSSSLSISKPVPVASSDCVSSSGGYCGGFGLKRTRETLGICSDDEIGCYSSSHGESSSSTTSASRLLKQQRLADGVNNLARNQEHGETESRSTTGIISSLKKLQKHMVGCQ